MLAPCSGHRFGSVNSITFLNFDYAAHKRVAAILVFSDGLAR
jgi:hypothetical protein